jgi:uncharacterized membrane protein
MADKNFNEYFESPETTYEYDTNDINQNKVFAVLAGTGFLFWLPLVAAPQSRFAKFWANQGLIILIFDIAVSFASKILGIIPFVGDIIALVLGLALLVYIILAMVWAGQGKAKELPLIGGLIKVIK